MLIRHAVRPFTFAAFLFLQLSTLATAAPAQVGTYDQLVHAIREVRTESRERVEQAVRQEKVREAWETGKLIDEHVLQFKERADYGEQVLERLAADLGSSVTELRYTLQFARAYPIRPTSGELSWAQYRDLLGVNEAEARNVLTERAAKEKWTVKEMRQEIKKLKAGDAAGLPVEAPLEAKPGIPGTYRVLKATVGEHKGELVLDLGFSCYFRPDKKYKFREGDIVMLEKGKLKKSKLGVEVLYTYRADVVQVIDGDTLKVSIPLGFGFTIVQKLRLRGLDAPEIQSAEGKEAKAFLEKMLRSTEAEKQEKSLYLASGLSASPVLVRTVKSDKYDRYLADVFIDCRPQTADHSQSEVSSPQSDFVYVNQSLLDEGLAARVQS
ncbi:MAG: DUF1016 N-terminal domain-containing protein [Candidatus Omnitrophota bacterium]